MKKLYKYIAPEHFDKIFAGKSSVSLKASHPQEFNDPYELFLTIDSKGLEPAVVAYYHEIVGAAPQWPTICFSARPDIIPMWAHYARECTGVVIEFNQTKIREAFPEASIQEVKYSERPTIIDAAQISYAYETAKPRHANLVRRAAFDAAYFTKSRHWSYELEHRFVVDNKNVSAKDGIKLIDFSIDCVSAIIAGSRMNSRIAVKIREFCDQRGYAFYEMRIGRSSMQTFFTGNADRAYIFEGEDLVTADICCNDCNEPLTPNSEEKCHWCAVTEIERRVAAGRNPLRALAQLGMLEDYTKRVRDSERKSDSGTA